MYFHLRAVPPSALRNSPTWLRRLFQDDWDTVRERIGRHREEVLARDYLQYEVLYAGPPARRTTDGPRANVVLGGRPATPPEPDLPPFRVLTAAQVALVAAYLKSTDFEDLWRHAREDVLPGYGGADAEPEAHCVFAATHRDLTAFYTRTAHYGDAVVKWLLA